MSNNPSLRELTLAVLARQRGGGETQRETPVRQGVLPPPHCETPPETPLAQQNEPLNPSVSLSHPLWRETVRHHVDRETVPETTVRRSSTSPYAEALSELRRQCPQFVDHNRWQQCLADAETFIDKRGRQASALGWTSGDLFKLHAVPSDPHPSYSRLSRRDATGLAWILQGRRVTAMSSTIAAIETPSGGIVKYRK